MKIRTPQVVLPQMYILPMVPWGFGWCKLGEVHALAQELSLEINTGRQWTLEKFVRAFADLVEPNRPVQKTNEDGTEVKGVGKTTQCPKKIFRYVIEDRGSFDFFATEIPQTGVVAHSDFLLGIGAPYPQDMFVPASWACTTLVAVLQGAVEAFDSRDSCFAVSNFSGPIIHPVRVILNHPIQV